MLNLFFDLLPLIFLLIIFVGLATLVSFGIGWAFGKLKKLVTRTTGSGVYVVPQNGNYRVSHDILIPEPAHSKTIEFEPAERESILSNKAGSHMFKERITVSTPKVISKKKVKKSVSKKKVHKTKSKR